MKWDDVQRIVAGGIPVVKSAEVMPETDVLEQGKCLLLWNTASQRITNYSEGDAASRVLALLLAIMVNIPHDSSFQMKCQPSITDYRSFTDYMRNCE